MRRPLVLVSACTQQIGLHAYHVAQQKYVSAVQDGANCIPLIIPALGERSDWKALLDVADGVLLTGSPSNVGPHYFGQPVHNPALPLDAMRDATTMPLLRAALVKGVPLLGICRGAQEINVALGGSLHQAVHEVSGMLDHRDNDNMPLEMQYAFAHTVSLEPGGKLQKILGGGDVIGVNSLHGQGIARLALGLKVEARAEDGLIEAFSGGVQDDFVIGVQWHPEWHCTNNPVSSKLFLAFGEACRAYQLRT